MKKLLSLLLTMSLILSLTVPAFAAETEGQQMERALKTVKALVQIPASLTEFTYTYSDTKTPSGSMKIWNFNWNDKSYLASVNVSVDQDGNLINLGRYDAAQKPVAISNLTKENAEKIAAAFLAKAVNRPGLVYKKVDSTMETSGTDSFYFNFRPYINGIPSNIMNISIGVNKATSQVSSFWTDDSRGYATATAYPSAAAIITKEEARKAYLEQIKLPLKYFSYYDYTKKTRTIFAAYSLNDSMFQAIDATTGKAIPLSYGYRTFDSMSQKAESANQAGTVELSKEELEAIQAVTKLITREQAESVLRSYLKLPADSKAASAYLRHEQYVNDSYAWSFSYDNASGEVDAQTGQLVSFYQWPAASDRTGDIGKEAARDIAENLIRTLAPKEFDQSRYDDTVVPTVYDGYAKESAAAAIQPETYEFTYLRQVDGHDFDANRIQVSVSRFDGAVNSYYKAWDAKAVFPSVAKAMDPAVAFDLIDGKNQFGLVYTLSKEGKVVLVYDFIDSKAKFVDPVTGDFLDWTGKVVKEKNIAAYTDLAGHWAEKIVNALKDNGYYAEGTTFSPNAKTTQKAFLRLLYGPNGQYYQTDEEFYNYLISIDMITRAEMKPEAALTRQDAAKFATRYLGYDKLAGKTAIFKYPFKDKVEANYAGYASICYAMNVMKGDAKGNFNGSAMLTNAEAAAVIYNLLQVK